MTPLWAIIGFCVSAVGCGVAADMRLWGTAVAFGVVAVGMATVEERK